MTTTLDARGAIRYDCVTVTHDQRTPHAGPARRTVRRPISERTRLRHSRAQLALRGGRNDLVTEKGGALIFVEVRTRRGDRLGTPEESITPAKRAKLIAAAQTYLDEHGQTDRAWRIDVVAIEIDSRGEVKRCNLIENAIEET